MADADPAQMPHQDPDQGRVTQVRAADGYTLTYRTWARDDRPPTATLVLLNGVMSHSLWFYPLARPLLDAGFKLVGADRRGSGLNPMARGDAPSGRVLLDDARAIVEREQVPDRPLHLIGWCWGAVLGINLAADLGGALASLVLLAPGLFPTAELRQRMAAQQGASTARADPADSACLESPISEEMFTSGPALADFIVKDPHRLARFTPRFLEIMGKLGMGARLKLPRLAVPLLLVLARDDRATDNQETEHNFDRLTGGRAVVEYLDGAHGMQFDAPGALARTITAWINR